MKSYFRLGFYTLLISILVASCEKVDMLKVYNLGGASVLSASTNIIAAKPADSLKTIVSFTWTSPNYSVDSSSVKYIVEIDSAGRNFSKAAQKVVKGTLGVSFTAKELNDIVLGFGFKYNKEYNVDTRIVSSHANNNERLFSNVLTLKVTPYVVPPKVTPPTSKKLFLVGDATAGSWNNPVPVPSQEFTMIDSVTYKGQFYLKGGKHFLCLPVNGEWSNKYSVKDNNANGLNKGGDFGYNLSDNFPGPDKTGIYELTLDFQSGKFSIKMIQEIGLVYVAGDYQGWNPGNAPALASNKNNGDYDGYVNIPAGGTYAFKITSENSWGGTNYGDGGDGNLSTSGGDLKFPGPGLFRIIANTITNKYSITEIHWGIVGSFTGWGGDPNVSDIALVKNGDVWETTVTVSGVEHFKFRGNSDWGINLGDKDADNSLEYGGDDILLPSAGTYKLTLDLNNPGFYTYKVSKQ